MPAKQAERGDAPETGHKSAFGDVKFLKRPMEVSSCTRRKRVFRVIDVICFWYRLHPKARALFGLALLLVCGAAGLVAEGLHVRARATRVEGTVVGHDRKGRPVVDYQWQGKDWRHEESGPSVDVALGAPIGVYVPADDPSAVRLDWGVGLLFPAVWCCL